MRKITLFIVLLAGFVIQSVKAQIPENFNYQAVLRDNSGELIVNQSVHIRVSILNESSGGTTVYSEIHTLHTGTNGEINLKIGSQTPETGVFADINWGTGLKFMKVELDTGGGYSDMGAFQLLSVPYSMYAKDVANKDDADADPSNELQDISLAGTNLTLSDGSTIDLSIIQDGTEDADKDTTNEIQNLNLNNNILTITKNPNATQISLAQYSGTNTDNQELSLTGTNLSISGGNSVNLITLQDGVDDADNNPLNELQNISLEGDTLEITGGNKVVFPYDSSRWAVNSEKIYYNTGNVGIGSSNPISKLEVKATSAGTGALFQVINQNNDTVFAVYPDGVKVFVNPDTKGRVGGFAVSGRGYGKSGENDYLIVTPDSTRIYVNDTLTLKGRVGGFAVSGRGYGKSGENDYLIVTPDSTRVYVNEESKSKGHVGGFAVSGRGYGKGVVNDYLQVTRDSTRVYISDSGVKGNVGGFAISGRGYGKLGENKDFFNVSANLTAEKVLNESRVMWYPEKSAFLSGEVHVGEADSVGQNSTAMGYRSIAMGHQSQAFGYKSIAYGTYSTAIGYESESDTNSMAVGYQAKATGNDAFALGSGALAVADKSFAFGSVGIDSLGNVTGNTKAIGEYSYAFGLGSVSSGRGAFAMGANDTASGVFSTAVGYKTKASEWYTTSMGGYTKATADFATALGFKSEATNVGATSIGHIAKASGRYSVAMGKSTESVGDYSFSANQYTNANGYSSTAFGGYTTAGGQYALALGYSTSAGGQYSIAGGYLSNASAQFSIALGDQNASSGIGSFSMGVGNIASGKYSVALGDHNYAKSYTCFSIGQYNVDNGTKPTEWEGTDPLFIAGNGASGWEANALVLTKEGDLWIAGNYDSPSDIRLKDNIEKLVDVLPKVLKIEPVYFEFKNKHSHPKGRNIGFIAQEIEPLFPELISTDASGYLSIDYSKMSAILVQAIKEQQQIIENQEKENNELQNQINEINQKLKLLEELINKK